MLIVFFDIRGIVHREFVPQGQTINMKFYCEVLWHLRNIIRQKRLDLWCVKKWILHDDNAPCHQALLVREFLANHNMLSLPHPLYSPDLAPLPEDEDATERLPFSHRCRDPARIADYHTHMITKTPI
jgi:hypothetical protein